MDYHFWLIQRGTILRGDHVPKPIKGLPSPPKLSVDLHRMGAAEFECGSIPASYNRILYQYENYDVFTTPLQSYDDRTLYLICNRSFYDETLAELTRYKEEKYETKEYTSFAAQFEQSSKKVFNYPDDVTDFWWCIDENCDKPGSRHIGDWIAFLGDETVKNLFADELKEAWQVYMNLHSDKARKSMFVRSHYPHYIDA